MFNKFSITYQNEPHRHIAHNRKTHIGRLCENYVPMFLCGEKNLAYAHGQLN